MNKLGGSCSRNEVSLKSRLFHYKPTFVNTRMIFSFYKSKIFLRFSTSLDNEQRPIKVGYLASSFPSQFLHLASQSLILQNVV